MMIIRSKAGLLPRYLLEFLSFRSVRARLLRSNTGTAVPQLTAAQLATLKIVVPPVLAQQQFVKRVDAVKSQGKLVLQDLNAMDRLFASLQHRAFCGEL